MSKVFNKNKEVIVEVPETWQEVNPAHFYSFIKIFQISDVSERQHKAVKTLLREYANKIDAKDVMVIYSIMQFLHDRVLDDDGEPIFEHQKLLTTPIIKNISTRLAMPEKELENFTCKQFMNCEDGLQKMINGNEMEGHKIFLEAFFGQPIEYVLKYAKGASLNYVFKFYTDCKEIIFHRIRAVAPDFLQADSQPGKVDFGWGGTFLQVAEGGTFGTYKEVLNANLHDVLIYLLQSWQRYQQQLKEQNDNV